MGFFFILGQSLNFLIWSFYSFFFLNLFFDWVSFLFLMVLFTIVGRVLFFRVAYMVGEESRYKGFIMTILTFVFAMVTLVISGDWLRLILGWD